MSNELEYLGWLIKRLQHKHHRALDTEFALLDTSLVQWNALREIDRNPKSTQHRLAAMTFNSDQAFGTLLSRLQKRGLVEEQQKLGRATFHQLTQKGENLLREGQLVMSAVLAQSFSTLTVKERKQLKLLIIKVLDQ